MSDERPPSAVGSAPASLRADSGSAGAAPPPGDDALSPEAFAQLRAKLASVLEEKEQLAADVAALCEQRSHKGRGVLGAGARQWGRPQRGAPAASPPSSPAAGPPPRPGQPRPLTSPAPAPRAPSTAAAAAGYLISDQSAALRNDNALLRQQLRALGAERDSLGEDISQLRASKVQSDRGWRDALARAAELEGELGYYRSSNARAITDRSAPHGTRGGLWLREWGWPTSAPRAPLPPPDRSWLGAAASHRASLPGPPLVPFCRCAGRKPSPKRLRPRPTTQQPNTSTTTAHTSVRRKCPRPPQGHGAVRGRPAPRARGRG